MPKFNSFGIFFNSGKVVGEKSYSGWDAFVKNNDDRVKK